MEKLIVRPNFTAEQARAQPVSFGLVYICPKCKIGAQLVHGSTLKNTVRCNNCNEEYEKP